MFFDKVFPNEKINHESGKGMDKKFPVFLRELIISSIRKDNKLGLYYVLEGVDIADDLLEEFNNMSDVTVICLGKPSLTRDEYFKEVRHFEEIYLYGEWTKRLSDKELYRYCDYWIEEANRIKNMAKEKGFLFFDTSFDQEKVINKTFKQIKETNKKDLGLKKPEKVWVKK